MIDKIKAELERRMSLAAQHSDALYSVDWDKEAKLYDKEYDVLKSFLSFVESVEQENNKTK